MSEHEPNGEDHDFIAPRTGEATPEKEAGEPSPSEIVQFVRETYAEQLDDETFQSIEEEFQGDFDEACGYLLSTLIENGVDEAEYFEKLAERGIVLPG